MRIDRREMLLGGGSLATLLALRLVARATESVRQIMMIGDNRGAHVGFDPIGLLVKPGETVRWVNADKGNSHTTTAYHPDYFERVQRIPGSASPWDSELLLPGETFEWQLVVLQAANSNQPHLKPSLGLKDAFYPALVVRGPGRVDLI